MTAAARPADARSRGTSSSSRWASSPAPIRSRSSTGSTTRPTTCSTKTPTSRSTSRTTSATTRSSGCSTRGRPSSTTTCPQFCDARLGQNVHTLSLFDLYRDWATYAHPNFYLQHDYILQELPTRRVSYFPESAYWISADIDVPAFLPEYLYARWLDIHTLARELGRRGPAPARRARHVHVRARVGLLDDRLPRREDALVAERSARRVPRALRRRVRELRGATSRRALCELHRAADDVPLRPAALAVHPGRGPRRWTSGTSRGSRRTRSASSSRTCWR